MKNHFDIIILGLKSQGLFLLREYSRIGLKVLGIGIKGSIGLSSRYGHKIAISDLNRVDSVLRRYFIEGTSLFVTSDEFLNYLLDKDPSILRRNSCFPNFESALVFTNKLKTESMAIESGLLMPRLYSSEEIRVGQVDYPVILKWNNRTGSEGFKTIVLGSRTEFEKILPHIKHERNVIVQEYIPDGFYIDVSYGAFFE